MKRLAFLFFALTILVAGPSRADVKWFTRNLASTPHSGTARQAAADYLKIQAHRLGLAAVKITPVGITPFLDWMNVKFDVRHAGLKVFRNEVKARVAPDGSVVTVVTDLDPYVVPNALTPAITAQQAERAVEELWAQKGRYNLMDDRGVELGLLPMGSHAQLVYRVDLGVDWIGYRHFVDAVTGKVLYHFARIYNSLGRVYAENPVATPNTVDATLMYLDDETGPGNVLEGRSGLLKVFRHISGATDQWPVQMEHLAVGDASGNFLYDATDVQPTFDDAFTEVNLYYHLSRCFDYFTGTHGVSFPRETFGLANYNEDASPLTPYDNAHFTPVGANSVAMACGQGNNVDFGYDGDVIMHEFGHYVIDEVAGLGYMEVYFDIWGRNQMPGAIHEGLADYFSCTISGDGFLGEYSMGLLSGRDLANNTMICPDDMFGEPHMDGEVIGGATWEIREAIGTALADDVIFGGLSMLTTNSTFKDLGESIVATAQLMVANSEMTTQDASTVQSILQTRGLLDCGRYLDLHEGEIRRNYLFGFDMIAAYFGGDCATARGLLNYYIPGPFQFRYSVPADFNHDRVHFNIQMVPGTGDLLHKGYVRQGEMVRYRLESIFGFFNIAVAEQFDLESTETTESSLQITLDANSTPPLVPGEDYYFAFGYRNCPSVQGEITVTTSDFNYQDAGVDAEVPDAGPDAGTDGGPKKGCDCAALPVTIGGEPLSFVLLLCGLLMALAFFRRRRS